MAAATIETGERPAPDRGVVRAAERHRRRWLAVLCVSGAVGAGLFGVGAHENVRADHGSSTSRSWDASSTRLEAEAAAYFAEQANIARGRAADAARLQAAADEQRSTSRAQGSSEIGDPPMAILRYTREAQT